MRLSEVLSSLPVREILDATTRQLAIPGICRKKKDVLTRFILENLTPDVERNLRDRLAARTSTKPGTWLQKRKRDDSQPTPSGKWSRLDAAEPNDDGYFLELPSDTVLKSCYRQFYEAMSDAALEHVVCAVCRR